MLFNSTLLLFLFVYLLTLLTLGGCEGDSSGMVGGGSQVLWLFFFCLAVRPVNPQLSLFCIQFLPRGLCFDHWVQAYCMLTPQAGLLGQRECTFSLHSLFSQDCSELLAASHGPCLSTSPFPPPLFTPICPPSDVLMRRSLRRFCVVYRILC